MTFCVPKGGRGERERDVFVISKENNNNKKKNPFREMEAWRHSKDKSMRAYSGRDNGHVCERDRRQWTDKTEAELTRLIICVERAGKGRRRRCVYLLYTRWIKKNMKPSYIMVAFALENDLGKLQISGPDFLTEFLSDEKWHWSLHVCSGKPPHS